MEIEIYSLVLIVAAVVNASLALVLLHNNFLYTDYGIYHRSRTLTAFTLLIFALGFLLHYHLLTS